MELISLRRRQHVEYREPQGQQDISSVEETHGRCGHAQQVHCIPFSAQTLLLILQ